MMGLTESARHLPPLGTEEALRPLSRRSAECRHVLDSDTAPCHSMLGSLQAAFSSHRRPPLRNSVAFVWS